MSSKVTDHPIDQETRNIISKRYKRITKSINRAFWDSDSEIDHSIYVGSYGRRTAINTSDLDVLFELPLEEYEHFNSSLGNGQSRLLQAVKHAILNTYSNSDVKADGQVVIINFSDNMKFEILPAFRNETYFGWDGTYKYPDTHMGGNWMSTNPKAEIDAIAIKDKEENSNHLLTETCKHIRYIRDTCYTSYKLSGILVDSFVYTVIGDWRYPRKGEKPTYSSKSYEQHILDKYNEMTLYNNQLYAPGSNMIVDTSRGWNVLGKILNYMA